MIPHQCRTLGCSKEKWAEEGEGQLGPPAPFEFCSTICLVLIFGSIKNLIKFRLHLLSGQWRDPGPGLVWVGVGMSMSFYAQM